MNQQATPRQTCELTFNDVSDDLASRYARELRDWLLDARLGIEVERKSDNVDALNWGNILEIAIPIAADIATAASAVIITYIKMNRSSVIVKGKDYTVKIGPFPFRDLDKAVHALELGLQGLKDDKRDDHAQK